MKILIVSATLSEIEPLLLQFTFEKEINSNLKNYSYNNHKIAILITGIGMTATAFELGKTLATNTYDFALNLGITGSFDDDLKNGEIVHITSDQISELGAEEGEKFLSLAELNLVENNEEITNNSPIQNSIISSLKEVKGITVNTVHGNENSIKKVEHRLNPQVESMEGGAFLMACISENIPCSQIRSVSNKVEKRNKDNWDIPLAINNLCKTGLEIVNNL